MPQYTKILKPPPNTKQAVATCDLCTPIGAWCQFDDLWKGTAAEALAAVQQAGAVGILNTGLDQLWTFLWDGREHRCGGEKAVPPDSSVLHLWHA